MSFGDLIMHQKIVVKSKNDAILLKKLYTQAVLNLIKLKLSPNADEVDYIIKLLNDAKD
jgi:hypothetical protein